MSPTPDTPPDFWRTARVRLRAYCESDVAHCSLWAQDSGRAQHLEHVWAPPSPSVVASWVASRARQGFDNGDYSFIIEDSSAQPVGSISTFRCDQRTGTFSYGIDIAAAHRRRGHAMDAIRLVTRYYFEECRYQKVTVGVHAANGASIALHEKLGFTLEGRLRRMVYTGGAFQDELWFGQTAEEFAHPERVIPTNVGIHCLALQQPDAGQSGPRPSPG